MAYRKPLPQPSRWTRRYWEAAKEHKLVIQRCRACNSYVFYPKLYCVACFSDELEWVEASGKGKVYSYTEMMNSPVSSFEEDLPFVIAIIELEEGVRMLSHVVNCDPGDLTCDMDVEVVFEDIDHEFALPKFQPAG
jgi:hypothetical protein